MYPTKDRRQNTASSRIEGQLVATTRARGRAIVLLFDAARPPPPDGSGRPVSFAVVSEERLFQGAAPEQAGPFAAPFAFSLVPPGRYLLRGFIDRSGCLPAPVGCRPSDFIPWYAATSEPNFGDVGGAAVDPVTREARVVEISLDAQGRPTVATGVSVSFTDAAALPSDRPVFSVSSPSLTLNPSGPTLLELTPRPIEDGLVHQSAPAFLARYIDDDHDGVPDDKNGDGAPDLWPKVVIRKLAGGQGPQLDEDPPVALAAGIDPTRIHDALVDENGALRTTPVPVARLDVVVRPVAFDLSDPTAPQRLPSVPAGSYAVVLVQLTGQTWRVPNELSPAVAESLGLPAVAGQDFVLEVP